MILNLTDYEVAVVQDALLNADQPEVLEAVNHGILDQTEDEFRSAAVLED